MADTVQYLLEEMVPELEDLENKGYFSRPEIKAITKKRQDFEYALKRRATVKQDYLRYIEYEKKLEELRKCRKKLKKIKDKKGNLSEISIVKRIHFIYERATRKFKSDLDLWKDWIAYCKHASSFRQLSKVFVKAMQRHCDVPELWIDAAKWEFEHNGNMMAARSLMQQALRLCKGSALLWHEYFRLELLCAAKLAARQEILFGHSAGSSSDEAEDEDEDDEDEDVDMDDVESADAEGGAVKAKARKQKNKGEKDKSSSSSSILASTPSSTASEALIKGAIARVVFQQAFSKFVVNKKDSLHDAASTSRSLLSGAGSVTVMRSSNNINSIGHNNGNIPSINRDGIAGNGYDNDEIINSDTTLSTMTTDLAFVLTFAQIAMEVDFPGQVEVVDEVYATIRSRFLPLECQGGEGEEGEGEGEKSQTLCKKPSTSSTPTTTCVEAVEVLARRHRAMQALALGVGVAAPSPKLRGVTVSEVVAAAGGAKKIKGQEGALGGDGIEGGVVDGAVDGNNNDEAVSEKIGNTRSDRKNNNNNYGGANSSTVINVAAHAAADQVFLSAESALMRRKKQSEDGDAKQEAKGEVELHKEEEEGEASASLARVFDLHINYLSDVLALLLQRLREDEVGRGEAGGSASDNKSLTEAERERVEKSAQQAAEDLFRTAREAHAEQAASSGLYATWSRWAEQMDEPAIAKAAVESACNRHGSKAASWILAVARVLSSPQDDTGGSSHPNRTNPNAKRGFNGAKNKKQNHPSNVAVQLVQKAIEKLTCDKQFRVFGKAVLKQLGKRSKTGTGEDERKQIKEVLVMEGKRRGVLLLQL